MSESFYSEIRACLEKRLISLSGLPIHAKENVKYSSTTNTPYLKTSFLPTTRRRAAIGNNMQRRYDGYFIVDVRFPENTGPGAADLVADAIVEGFDTDTSFSFTNAAIQTVYVTCEYAERTNGVEDSPWYHIPITIQWFSYK